MDPGNFDSEKLKNTTGNTAQHAKNNAGESFQLPTVRVRLADIARGISNAVQGTVAASMTTPKNQNG